MNRATCPMTCATVSPAARNRDWSPGFHRAVLGAGDERRREGTMNISRVRRPWRVAAAALVAGPVLLSSGCGHGDKSPTWQGGGDTQANGSSAAAPSPSPTLSTVAVV